MSSYADLAQVVKASLRWESRLKDFYDIAVYALKNPESKKTVALLRDNQVERLGVLRSVDVRRFGEPEWIQFAPRTRDEDVIPYRIDRESAPAEVIESILGCERKLRDYYDAVRTNLVHRDHKELFGSLVTFKENQIEEIRRLA